MYFQNLFQYFDTRPEHQISQSCQCCSGNPVGGFHIRQGTTVFGTLHIVIDTNKILRVKTRAANNFDINYRFPMLIPKGLHFSYLYASEVHSINGHVGVNQTLSAIRQTVWIVHCRTLVNNLIKNCSKCKLQAQKFYPTPEFPSLPITRMSFDHPFKHVGIDLTGHYTLYHNGNKFKRYICIITIFRHGHVTR